MATSNKQPLLRVLDYTIYGVHAIFPVFIGGVVVFISLLKTITHLKQRQIHSNQYHTYYQSQK
ncbi:MAG TPA: hypothetical protein VGM63_20205, partial [Mucilaginibacter sp.]